MGRTPDPVYVHMEEMPNYNESGQNRWKCKYCGDIYAGKATRIKSHLSGINGKGIAVCPSVPKDVLLQVQAQLAAKSLSEEDLSSSAPSVTKRTKQHQDEGQASDSISHDIASSSLHMNVPISGLSSRPPKLPTVNAFKRGSIKAGFQKQAVDIATREITKLFIQCALSFNVVRTK